MSCFVVPDYHVSALVAWAIRADVLPDAVSPDALAHELATANRAAYSERYQGRYDSELAAFAGLDRSAGQGLAPVAIVKACDCLAYQAGDWSSWDQSDAAAYLVAIRAAALAVALAGHGIAAGPNAGGLEYGRELPGYDAAAWCLDQPDAAAERDQRLATLDYPDHELAAIRSALAATRCAA
jgi:hypothetical protein